MSLCRYVLFLILLSSRTTLINAGVFCYICYGITSTEGSSCNFNSICYGEACIMTMNSNGQWNSTCANDNSSSLYDQLNGQQCSSGNLSGYNGTYATCACGADFCNSPSLLGNQLMTKLNSTTSPVEPELVNPLTCFECGTVEGEDANLGASEINVTCDGTTTCQGNYCLTRKSINPRSYCASPWMGTLNMGCTKRQDEDELCVCGQSMCNYPYDPLAPVLHDPAVPNTTALATTPAAATTTISPCVNGYRIVSGNAIASSASGKFGGYFQFQSSCQELCLRDYGLLPCIGYMYEPNNRGKCTIFQYALNGFSTSPNATSIIYEKC